MLTDDTPQSCWVVLLTLPIFEISDKSIVITSNTARSPQFKRGCSRDRIQKSPVIS
ncbi:MAG: hypothetical protein V7L05_29245 [Nostoc sp.]|uniref:hypothetical protein n=1 Tax=Nostoc sp. TaxID=1180 RepID=UPI002FF9F687